MKAAHFQFGFESNKPDTLQEKAELEHIAQKWNPQVHNINTTRLNRVANWNVGQGNSFQGVSSSAAAFNATNAAVSADQNIKRQEMINKLRKSNVPFG